MTTHGLGGDSEVHLLAVGLKTRIQLGPRRAMPVSLLAAQHAPGTDQAEMRAELIEYVVSPVIPQELVDGELDVLGCLLLRRGRRH